MVGQTRKFGDNIPSDINRLVEVESTIMVATDNEFNSCFLRPTEACHHWCFRVVEDAAPPNFLSGLGHFIVFIGPLLDLLPEFLKWALLDLGIFDVLETVEQGGVLSLQLLFLGRSSG